MSHNYFKSHLYNMLLKISMEVVEKLLKCIFDNDTSTCYILMITNTHVLKN